MSRASVYEEIQAERREQDKQWGGPNHDDGHILYDWNFVVRKFLDKAAVEGEQEWKGDLGGWKPSSFSARRRRLVQVAAVVVAEIESIDRNRRRAAADPQQWISRDGLLHLLDKEGLQG